MTALARLGPHRSTCLPGMCDPKIGSDRRSTPNRVAASATHPTPNRGPDTAREGNHYSDTEASDEPRNGLATAIRKRKTLAPKISHQNSSRNEETLPRNLGSVLSLNISGSFIKKFENSPHGGLFAEPIIALPEE